MDQLLATYFLNFEKLKSEKTIIKINNPDEELGLYMECLSVIDIIDEEDASAVPFPLYYVLSGARQIWFSFGTIPGYNIMEYHDFLNKVS